MWTPDASIFVRAADANDPDQAVCQALLDGLDRTGASTIVPRLLIAEVAGAVRRITRDPIRARLAFDSLRFMPSLQFVTLDDVLLDEAALIAADRALKGADAVYVAVARRHGCTLVTLDRERAAPVVAVVAPHEVLATIGS